MLAIWIAAVVGGLVLTIFSSHQTLDSARTVARHLGLSPFIIGMTIMAIGTDLPEIANSIAASATDHGDINVGDSIGSVVTQITLVLGILCFVHEIRAERRFIAVAGLVTVIAVLIGAMLLGDDHLSRTDGGILIAFWVVGTVAVQRGSHIESTRQESLFTRGVLVSIRDLLVGLAGVALGRL